MADRKCTNGISGSGGKRIWLVDLNIGGGDALIEQGCSSRFAYVGQHVQAVHVVARSWMRRVCACIRGSSGVQSRYWPCMCMHAWQVRDADLRTWGNTCRPCTWLPDRGCAAYVRAYAVAPGFRSGVGRACACMRGKTVTTHSPPDRI